MTRSNSTCESPLFTTEIAEFNDFFLLHTLKIAWWWVSKKGGPTGLLTRGKGATPGVR